MRLSCSWLLAGMDGEPTLAQFPGLNSDGRRISYRMPRQELLVCPGNARFHRREAAPDDSRDIADEAIRANQAQSNQIKPNQTCETAGGRCGGGLKGLRLGLRKKRAAERRPVKPGQTQSNRFDSGSSKNTTIISEMIMLVPGPKLPSAGLIKPNQTKSKLRGGKKFIILGLRFKILCSKHLNTRRMQNKDDH
jgi:hypothetical protein